jgi:hypothetical protein
MVPVRPTNIKPIPTTNRGACRVGGRSPLSQEERMNINALYESVSNNIIKEMEAGTVPWVKPWKTPRRHGSVMPHIRAAR